MPSVSCESCKAKFKVTDEKWESLRGSGFACPKCGKQVPGPPAEVPAQMPEPVEADFGDEFAEEEPPVKPRRVAAPPALPPDRTVAEKLPRQLNADGFALLLFIWVPEMVWIWLVVSGVTDNLGMAAVLITFAAALSLIPVIVLRRQFQRQAEELKISLNTEKLLTRIAARLDERG